MAMQKTSVTYHDGQAAINVKCRVAGLDFWPESFRSLPEDQYGCQEIGNTTAADIVDAAYNIMQERFWEGATDRAEATPLGRIYPAGRSGGWLVFEVDPTHGGEDNPGPMWLAAYGGLTIYCERFIARAPKAVAALAEQIAMDELGAGPARRMFGASR